MDTKTAGHSNLTLLLAFAIIPAGMLVEQRMAPDIISVVPGCLLLLTALALLIIPPLRRRIPWPGRLQAALLRLIFWAIFAAFTAYAFGTGKR